jgi:hypothetical protein
MLLSLPDKTTLAYLNHHLTKETVQFSTANRRLKGGEFYFGTSRECSNVFGTNPNK